MIHNSVYMWVAPLIAMLAAQVLKPILIMVQLRRFDWQRMRQSGGMPSSHTALVVALVTELCLRYGGRDPGLAIGLFVALVVMYDAAGVRWQTGRQAAVLNRLLHDLRGQRASQQSHLVSHASPTNHPSSESDLNVETASDGSDSALEEKVDVEGQPVRASAPAPASPPVPQHIHPIQVAKAPWWLFDWPVLNEYVGHKPIEVIGGCIVGVAVGLILR